MASRPRMLAAAPATLFAAWSQACLRCGCNPVCGLVATLFAVWSQPCLRCGRNPVCDMVASLFAMGSQPCLRWGGILFPAAPESCVRCCRKQNGGKPRRRCARALYFLGLRPAAGAKVALLMASCKPFPALKRMFIFFTLAATASFSVAAPSQLIVSWKNPQSPSCTV